MYNDNVVIARGNIIHIEYIGIVFPNSNNRENDCRFHTYVAIYNVNK